MVSASRGPPSSSAKRAAKLRNEVSWRYPGMPTGLSRNSPTVAIGLQAPLKNPDKVFEISDYQDLIAFGE